MALTPIQPSGYAHFALSLSFSYSGRATLILHLSCRYHSHTAVGLRSFYIAVSLSLSYSGRAAHILHCRVTIIVIQRSGYAHFALSLSFSYSCRATLILHCRVTLIVIQRSGCAHFTLPCRYHCHTAVGLRSFCISHVALISIECVAFT